MTGMLPLAKKAALQKLANQGLLSFNPDAVNKEIDEYFGMNQVVKYQGVLDEFINHGWDIVASEIYELTGSRPRIKQGQDCHHWGSYRFFPSGKRNRAKCYQVGKAPCPGRDELDNNRLNPIRSYALPSA